MKEIKEYRVMITESRQKTVFVKAGSEDEAHRRTEDACKNSEYMIGEEAFQGVDFHVLGEADGDLAEKDLERIEQKGGEPDV